MKSPPSTAKTAAVLCAFSALATSRPFSPGATSPRAAIAFQRRDLPLVLAPGLAGPEVADRRKAARRREAQEGGVRDAIEEGSRDLARRHVGQRLGLGRRAEPVGRVRARDVAQEEAARVGVDSPPTDSDRGTPHRPAAAPRSG
jgi:hypothetical protein